jgi:hypothetical protein
MAPSVAARPSAPAVSGVVAVGADDRRRRAGLASHFGKPASIQARKRLTFSSGHAPSQGMLPSATRS